MKVRKYRDVFSFKYFDIDFSEDELNIVNRSIDYVLEHCDEIDIYDWTGCEDQEQLEAMYPGKFEPDEIRTCPDFDFQISEGQLMVFEGSLDFVMKHCDEEEMRNIIGYTKREIKQLHDQIVETLIKYVPYEYLSDKLQSSLKDTRD